jgi:hypothetical protein
VYLEGGGTIPWLGLVHRGLSDPEHPNWGGWSGSYSGEKVKNAWSRHQDVKADEQNYDDFAVFVDVADRWTDPEAKHEYNNTYTPVWRWRRAFFNDFKCRMDWGFAAYEEANHNPTLVVNGNQEEKIQLKDTKPGDRLLFDITDSSDPDADTIEYRCWYYKEAGTYPGKIEIEKSEPGMYFLNVPEEAEGTEIHLILEINDINPIANLYDYRRVVLRVRSLFTE